MLATWHLASEAHSDIPVLQVWEGVKNVLSTFLNKIIKESEYSDIYLCLSQNWLLGHRDCHLSTSGKGIGNLI